MNDTSSQAAACEPADPGEAKPPFDAAREARVALWLAAVVLALLTVAKPWGTIPYLGSFLLTAAAAAQLILPLRRVDALDVDLDFVGLHLRCWRQDARIVLLLCLIFFPPYAILHHLFLTSAHGWLMALDWVELAAYVPQMRFAPRWPSDAAAWTAGIGWMLSLIATHTFGVALPEETFYRGYLQPRLQQRWAGGFRIFGARLGRAEGLSCALFALGHFLGEWDPLRLGPFLPGLIFAWQRNRTGSVVGAIAFHAACNVVGALLFVLYRPL